MRVPQKTKRNRIPTLGRGNEEKLASPIEHEQRLLRVAHIKITVLRIHLFF